MKTLGDTDKMPPELRGCVHEFGYEIVNEIYCAGVRKPNAIRAIVYTCWLGARQNKQREPGGRSRVETTLNALLIQSGSGLTAAAIMRVLWMGSMAVVSRNPSSSMIEASMDAHLGAGVLSKHDKHALRLRKAVEAGARHLCPELDE